MSSALEADMGFMTRACPGVSERLLPVLFSCFHPGNSASSRENCRSPASQQMGQVQDQAVFFLRSDLSKGRL